MLIQLLRASRVLPLRLALECCFSTAARHDVALGLPVGGKSQPHSSPTLRLYPEACLGGCGQARAETEAGLKPDRGGLDGKALLGVLDHPRVGLAPTLA